MAEPLRYFFEDQIIEVPIPDTTLDLQYLVNQTRDTEDELHPALVYTKIIDAYGKQSLGGGTFVGITVMLLENWKVRFEARTEATSCIISGGNIVAESGNPVAPSANVTVSIAQSTSPSIIQAETDYGMLYLLESMRGSHKSIGSIFYWNPSATDDTGAGTTPATAVKTFSRAHTLVTDGAGDVIFALSTAAGGISTSEVLTITKNNLKVRGPGYPFTLSGTLGSPTVSITGNNVELSGFYITTAGGGTNNGVTVTGDKALIQDCWIQGTTGNGIDVSSSTRSQIDTCAIEDCTGYGINVGNATSSSKINKCILSGNAEGIELYSNVSVTDNIFENNLIYNNTNYGINIGTNTTRTVIRLHHSFSGNGSGSADDINGTGIDTYIETGGAVTPTDIAQIASDTASAVWDELISSHTTAGTTGKTLKDAKTKATLASLK